MKYRFPRPSALLCLALLTASCAMGGEVSTETKTQTIDALFAAMRKEYVFPEKAAEAERTIRSRVQKGEYANVQDGQEFAQLLTEHLRAVCQDAHLGVRYSE